MFQTKIQRFVGVIEVFHPLLLDISAVEVEEDAQGHDDGDATDNVSSRCRPTIALRHTYHTPRTMARVVEDPPTGFSHRFLSVHAVVVWARAATIRDGNDPRVDVTVSRALIRGIRGPMA
jgi:hypothetical protein